MLAIIMRLISFNQVNGELGIKQHDLIYINFQNN